MAQSFYRPTSQNVIEDYENRNQFYHAPSDRYYRMIHRDGRFYQRRYQLNDVGIEKNILEQEVTYIIGSGRHARTYLNLSEQGVLRQLPVTWYPQEKIWGMSPGYDHRHHDGFKRRITHSCLFCHNAYPLGAQASDRYGQKSVFPQDLPLGIGCGRCHGSGARHISLAEDELVEVEEIRRSIVNPARLSSERQMDICLQCHLEAAAAAPRFRRGGRPVYSFEPGESLEDYIVHFDLVDPSLEDGSDRFEIDSAGYRLRQSSCFLQSFGEMTCTTCHDPHQTPRGEEVIEHFRTRCLQCHHQPSPSVHKEISSSNCVRCHMPKRRTEDVVHVVMTDHLIQRHLPQRDLVQFLPEDHSPKQEQLILHYPESLPDWEKDVYLGMAEVQSRGHLRKGLERLEAALGLKEASFTEPYIKLATAQARIGRLVAAQLTLDRALEIDPKMAIGYFNLAEVRRKQGQMTIAAENYSEAIRIDPNYAKAHHQLGIVRKSQQDQSVIRHFQQALRSDPLFLEAYLSLGRTYLQRGKVLEATDQFEKGLEIEPASAEIYLNLGLGQSLLGHSQAALEAFQQAIGLKPHFSDAHYNLGLARAQMGQLGKAVESFQEAIRLKPNDPEAHANLGVAYSELGKLEAAISAFQQAIQIQPDSMKAYYNLGLAQANLGRYREAIESLSETARLAPKEAEVRLNLGFLYLEEGDRTSAIKQYELLKKIDAQKANQLLERMMVEESGVRP